MKIVMARVALVAGLCLSNISCGGDAPTSTLYPVRGKVTYRAQPAEGAIVTLMADGEAPLTKQGSPIVPMGIAGEDGTFKINSTGLGEGAPAGKYKVLITWRPSSKIAAAKPLLARKKKSSDYNPNDLMPADAFDGRYSNPGKPLFTAEVKAEPNELPPFDLKD